MELIIGGYAQGKWAYVVKEAGREQLILLEGRLPEEHELKRAEEAGQRIVIRGFHLWVRDCLLQGRSPEEAAEAFLQRKTDSIIISDEIGNGIVPVAAFEREYRERTGRLLVRLAGQADKVVRVVCGIGQRLK